MPDPAPSVPAAGPAGPLADRGYGLLSFSFSAGNAGARGPSTLGNFVTSGPSFALSPPPLPPLLGALVPCCAAPWPLAPSRAAARGVLEGLLDRASAFRCSGCCPEPEGELRPRGSEAPASSGERPSAGASPAAAIAAAAAAAPTATETCLWAAGGCGGGCPRPAPASCDGGSPDAPLGRGGGVSRPDVGGALRSCRSRAEGADAVSRSRSGTSRGVGLLGFARCDSGGRAMPARLRPSSGG